MGATTQIVREKGTWEMIVVGEIVKEVNVIGVTVTEEITRGVVVIRGIKPEVIMTGAIVTGAIVTEVIGTEGIMTEGIMTEVIGVTETRMKIVADIVTPLLHRVRTRRESLRKVKENKRDIPLVLILTEIDMT